MQDRYAQQIDEQVGQQSGPLGPEIKAMDLPKPGKYGGQDDLKKIDDWVSQLLKYFRTSKITGLAWKEDQVLYIRLFLKGLASEWYGQEIESPDHKVYFWSFEDLICGLFKRFVHKALAQNTANQYDRTRYDAGEGSSHFL